MARPKIKTDKESMQKAEAELALIPGGKLAMRLLAIAAAGRHPVEQVALIFDVSPRTIFRWVDRFNSLGVEGLKDRPKGHLPAKLSDSQVKILTGWIEEGRNARGQRTRWTLEKLKQEVKSLWQIDVSTTALWNLLKKLDLSLK